MDYALSYVKQKVGRNMQITLNPLEVSKAEWEALARFILTFPGTGQMAKETIHIPDSPELREAIANINPAAGKLELISDPAAAFGASDPPPPPATIIPQGPISPAGPMLVIPNPEPAPAAPAPPATGATLDKDGLPWDARIHASTKTFNADGTWRKKRGVETTLIQTVEGELKKLMAIPSPAAAAPTPPVPPPPPGPATTQAAPPPPANATEVELRMQFVGLVGRASAAIQNGKLLDHELNSTCAFAGVGSLPLLGNRLDLVPQVAATIDQIIASRP